MIISSRNPLTAGEWLKGNEVVSIKNSSGSRNPLTAGEWLKDDGKPLAVNTAHCRNPLTAGEWLKEMENKTIIHLPEGVSQSSYCWRMVERMD